MPDRLPKDEDVLTRPELEMRGDGVLLAMPTCPFARQGLGSRLMASCPGYRAETLSFKGLGAGESLGERVSCCHLGTQRGGRGYVSACRHPGGRPPEADQLAARAGRRRLSGN